MSAAFHREQYLFVVRTWQEPSQVIPGEQWRGSIEHIPSGRRLYFTTLDQISQFVATYTGWPAATGADTGADTGSAASPSSSGNP